VLRPIVIAGNWKMYKSQREALDFMQGFLDRVTPQTRQERTIVLCMPFTILSRVGTTFQVEGLGLGAQNMHWADNGAFTGEIAGEMLTELETKYVIVGHSERRQYFGETDQTVNLRLRAAQRHNLTPILCVGETKAQRDQGEAEAVIRSQLLQALVQVDQSRLIIAYEPIWAIGTGETCASSEANKIIGFIRSQLSTPHVPIQYGGSVKPENIDEIMAQTEIDGVLVGGASLDPVSFARIVNFN
jgi:triosephosphate isomerase (TIM)